jgi:RNA polymerase sigma-70 factor (ECF subfamily)
MPLPDAAATLVQPVGDQLRPLFDRAREGDRVALEELCLVVRPRLYRAAFAIVRDRDEADDVAQEALVRAVTKRFMFLGTGSVVGWMSKIAVNLAKNRRRDHRRRGDILRSSTDGERDVRGAQPAAANNPERTADEKQQRGQLREALAALTERQREVVELRVVADLSFKDIADALGMTEAHARVTFSQAKGRLLDATAQTRENT